MSAKFIVFEGIDGSGKSTVLDQVAKELKANGKTVLINREPGTTAMGLAVRQLLKSGTKRSRETELFLQEASRRDIFDTRIKPNLDKYDYIINDRYIYSTIAYQGAGRGNPINVVNELNFLATDNLVPDLAILIDTDLATAAQRQRFRQQTRDDFDRHFDQIDDFSKRVYHSYQGMVATGELTRVVNNDLDQTVAQCLKLINNL